MKEQLMDTGNREVLGYLIGVASTLGISALLAQRYFSRRGNSDRVMGVAVLELFVVVAIFVSSLMTAYLSIHYLVSEEPVTDALVGRIAIPLVLSGVLLIALIGMSGFASLPGGIRANGPVIAATAWGAIAVAVAVSYLAGRPEAIPAGVVVILAVGGLVAWLFLRIERFSLKDRTTGARRRTIRLFADGYEPTTVAAALSTPERRDERTDVEIAVWSRKGRIYLDQCECSRLEVEVEQRWTDLATGAALPPAHDRLLLQVQMKSKVLPWPPKLLLAVETSAGSRAAERRTLEVNSDGLFDVTDLGLV